MPRPKPAATLPQTDTECAALIAEHGRLTIQIKKAKADLDGRIADAKDKAEATVAPLLEEQQRAERAIEGYCASRRRELTDDGRRKFHDFETGRVLWKDSTDRVVIESGAEKHIIEELEQLGLGNLVRVKKTIDKAGLKKLPRNQAEAIDGVRIENGGECFVIKPAGGGK